MTALALALLAAATPAPGAPTSPVVWILGPNPAAGSWASYDGSAELVNFVPGPDGDLASGHEAKLTQRTRVTFLHLGRAAVDGATGDWLEIQEELLEMKGEGVPEGLAGGGASVMRVLLSPDGKPLRTVVQRPGAPAEEQVVGEGMAVAIGALSPFEGLQGDPKPGRDTLLVAKLGKVAATTHEASAASPPRRTKIWRRASDGLCLRIVEEAKGMGTTTYVLTGAGRGGATKVVGPIRLREAGPAR